MEQRRCNDSELIARIDERTESMEKQISALFRKLDDKLDKKTFYWIGGLLVTILLSLFGILNTLKYLK